MNRRTSFRVLTVMTCLLAVLMIGGRKKQEETSSSAAQLTFGVEMAKRGLWSEALFRFKQAARSDPGNPRILNNMAVAYEALGNFEKALDFYQDAIRSDPGNRELKRNYSRFVEFYRAFKPDQPSSGESEQVARVPSGP
jgi:Tfp pilus assembly protein PilF